MEDVKFVNNVKSLILELGCVPGALLFDNYATKDSAKKVWYRLLLVCLYQRTLLEIIKGQIPCLLWLILATTKVIHLRVQGLLVGHLIH